MTKRNRPLQTAAGPYTGLPTLIQPWPDSKPATPVKGETVITYHLYREPTVKEIIQLC